IRRSPGLAIPMLFCLVALVGLPPFAGFLVKYYLLAALGEANSILHWTLVVVAVINTLISLWFYMRVVVQMMLKDDERPAFDTPLAGLTLVNVCGIVLIVILVLGSPLKKKTDQVARQIFNPAAVSVAGAPEPVVLAADE
ncbi:MAG: hypothetical protein H6816_11510, partial [Phycisphaerales bacterium]|nr:hypothetical protein [Phycisphaerales bacterium]